MGSLTKIHCCISPSPSYLLQTPMCEYQRSLTDFGCVSRWSLREKFEYIVKVFRLRLFGRSLISPIDTSSDSGNEEWVFALVNGKCELLDLCFTRKCKHSSPNRQKQCSWLVCIWVVGNLCYDILTRAKQADVCTAVLWLYAKLKQRSVVIDQNGH